MKYHYTKPTEYSSMYGQLYECNHPAYNHCTLYLIGDKGLAVIQQRYDKKSKCTWWSEIDRCLTDALYLHSKFKSVFDKYASTPTKDYCILLKSMDASMIQHIYMACDRIFIIPITSVLH